METIGTYDVWNKEKSKCFIDRAYKCMLGLIAKYNNQKTRFFTGYFLEPHPWNMVEDLVDYGSVVQSYLENFQNEKINKNAFETVVVNTLGSGPIFIMMILCVYSF